MSEGLNDGALHRDRDANLLFARGLALMLSGVALSVVALIFLPRLEGIAQAYLVFGGLGLSGLLVYLIGARPVWSTGALSEPRSEPLRD
ncbi:hypothetical protein VCB98_04805 [Gammaproteobacteria bacterium AB-CW1]|uniref:Uncharacterized protein n=1 Tax=Natronospira elongata TaxID=3110268 RepID=A0AAP6ML22_9GAMM|nr:hypothetical protein [Gammaproteobacteria bacterium AB-CW1]